MNPHLIVLVGSAFLGLANYIKMYPEALFVIADVPVELRALKLSRQQRSKVILLPVGEGLTIKQLAKLKFSAEQIDAIQQNPNVNLIDGLAQVMGIGQAAMLHLLEQKAIAAKVKDITKKLRAIAEGELDDIHLSLFCGSSGGCGAAGGRVLFNHLVNGILEDESLNIRADIHLLGPLTFTNMGFPRTQLNAGISVAQWVHQSLHSLQDRLTITFLLREVPAAGVDREVRANYLLDQDQGLSSPNISQFLDMVRTNQAANGPFGNMVIPRFDHFNRLPMSRVAADVAGVYIPQLDELCETPADSKSVVRIIMNHETETDQRLTDEQLASSCLDNDEADFHLELASEALPVTASVIVELADGTLLPLGVNGSCFGTSIDDLESLRSHIGLLRAIGDELTTELESVKAEEEELQGLIAGQTKSCFKQIRRACRSDGERYSDRSFQALEASIGNLREQIQFAAEAEAEIESLALASKMVNRELGSLVDRIDSLINQIDDCGLQVVNHEALVDPLPLSSVLGELLATAERMTDSKKAMSQLLSRSVANVTLDGLAAISGAANPSVDAIVTAVTEGHACERGSNWGGKKRTEDCSTFVVYPPVSSQLAEDLEIEHARSQLDDSMVAFAHPSSRAVNIVRIEFREVSELGQVITPHLMDGIAKSLSDPLAPLFIADPSFLNDLNIQISSRKTAS